MQNNSEMNDDAVAKPLSGVDESVVDERLGHLRLLQDSEGHSLMPKIVASYLVEGAEHLAAMIRILDDGDLEALGRLAHAHGGTSIVLGGETVFRLCETLQLRASQGDFDGSRVALRAVDAASVELFGLLRERTEP